MTTLLPRFVFRGGLFAIVWLLSAAATWAGDITGTYKCEGDAGGGRKYGGTVSITQKGDTYAVVWKLSGNETYTGLGLIQGDVLAVSYYGKMTGVIAYKIESDSKLVGKWAVVPTTGAVAGEVLTR